MCKGVSDPIESRRFCELSALEPLWTCRCWPSRLSEQHLTSSPLWWSFFTSSSSEVSPSLRNVQRRDESMQRMIISLGKAFIKAFLKESSAFVSNGEFNGYEGDLFVVRLNYRNTKCDFSCSYWWLLYSLGVCRVNGFDIMKIQKWASWCVLTWEYTALTPHLILAKWLNLFGRVHYSRTITLQKGNEK